MWGKLELNNIGMKFMGRGAESALQQSNGMEKERHENILRMAIEYFALLHRGEQLDSQLPPMGWVFADIACSTQTFLLALETQRVTDTEKTLEPKTGKGSFLGLVSSQGMYQSWRNC